jgi:putative transposase
MKGEPEYTVLPRKMAQWVLKQVCAAWDRYKEALAAWETDPSTFLDRPRIPRYKRKQQGRNLLVYTTQALSVPALRNSLISPSGLGVTVQTRQSHIQQVRIIPRIGFYVVEVIYEQEPVPATVNPALRAGVDSGLNNLAVLTADTPGVVPRLVNGRPVKSSNQFSNKRRAELQSWLGDLAGSWELWARVGAWSVLPRGAPVAESRIDWYLHTASRRLIDPLVAEGIGTLCIGKNPRWKQNANMGRRNNQHVVAVPHARFIEMLAYKAGLVGIHVCLTEESYTSRASFLDGDPLPIYDPTQPVPTFSGRRVKRGQYGGCTGRRMGDPSTLTPTVPTMSCAKELLMRSRKGAPDAFAQGSS